VTFIARLAGVLAVVLAVGVAGLELYTWLPVGERTPPVEVPAGTTRLVLVIHGAGDEDNPLLPAIVTDLEARFAGSPGTAVRYLRWDPESDQRLRAAATARDMGLRLGRQLAARAGLTELHLVAHSVGTFMPDAICEAWRAYAPAPAHIVMVLLDPFQIRGFADWGWGARNHGRCADFALAVINTDDPAPATNRPLAQAWNLDVTADPARAGFDRNGHYWPVRYYRDHLLALQPELARWNHATRPRGAVSAVAGGALPAPAGPQELQESIAQPGL
jgi:hypothetical protein